MINFKILTYILLFIFSVSDNIVQEVNINNSCNIEDYDTFELYKRDYEYKIFDFYFSPNLIPDEIDTLTISFLPMLAVSPCFDSLNNVTGLPAGIYTVEVNMYVDTNLHYLGDYSMYSNNTSFVYNTIEDSIGSNNNGSTAEYINLLESLSKIINLYGKPVIINKKNIVKLEKNVQFYNKPTNKQAVLVGYCYRIIEAIEFYRNDTYDNNIEKSDLVNAWFPINPNFADTEYHYSIKARKRK